MVVCCPPRAGPFLPDILFPISLHSSHLKCCDALGIFLTPRSRLWLSSCVKHPECIARPGWNGRQQHLLTLSGLHTYLHYSFFSLSPQQDSSIVCVPDSAMLALHGASVATHTDRRQPQHAEGSCRTWLGSVAFLRICCSVFSTPQRLSSVPMKRMSPL